MGTLRFLEDLRDLRDFLWIIKDSKGFSGILMIPKDYWEFQILRILHDVNSDSPTIYAAFYPEDSWELLGVLRDS